MSGNLTHVEHLVSRDQRRTNKGHKGGVFWLTGLSASGKSTLAMRTEEALLKAGLHAYVLDGDNVRKALCSDLAFSEEDRKENIRRVADVAALMADAGLVVIAAFISPFAEDRKKAREKYPEHFNEIYVKADLATCEERDPKGLYKKARAGEIDDFTGIDSPYEEPLSPDLTIDTQSDDVDSSVRTLFEFIKNKVAL